MVNILEREQFVTTLSRLFTYAETNYPELPASRLIGGDQKYTYAQLSAKVRELSALLSRCGIGAGQKIAIYSQNMPNWTVAYFTSTVFGRVVVPILAESSTVEVENILEHSETSVLFVSRAKFDKVSPKSLEQMKLVFILDTLELAPGYEAAGASTSGTPAEVREPQPDDLAGIFYTSGTTGSAKGVMLSHRNLCQNIIAAWHTYEAKSGHRWLSILPMAHTYEMAFDLLYPYFVGAEVSYISKAPTVSVLTKALDEVKPHVVCSVPLIIEKIYRGSVRKTIESNKTLRLLEKICPTILYRLVGSRVLAFFGGSLEFFGIGGAKLDPVVENFLLKAKFPYAIGYGLTETAPLICSAQVGKGRCGSIGWHALNVDVRLGDIDPKTGEGEIQCKGPNVMLGYYKDPQRTASVFTEDGWFKTGDLASFDKKTGYYYIRGRIGTMIVGPSGENVYPEEIESVINNFEDVSESLVISRDGKLVALVKLDDNAEPGHLEFIKDELMNYVNSQIKKSNNIQQIEIVTENFIKTATQKIKRYLYK